MSKMIITVGCSGTGKTTWAEQYIKENSNTVIICRDDLRNTIFGLEGYKHTKKREKVVTEKAIEMFGDAVDKGVDVIIADTNLSKSIRTEWTHRAEHVGYSVIIQEFPVSDFDKLVSLNQHRGVTSVPTTVLSRQWANWLAYKESYTYHPNLDKPKALIVDIDGTIAIKGNRNAYDWEKVGMDTPRKDIIQMIQQFATLHRAVILFVSGRDGVCYTETRKWLCDNTYFTGSLGDQLIMRPQGDSRKDSIVKKEIFTNIIADNYNVLAVFDDRPQVVDMWYDIGMKTVITVADQRNRF